MSERDEIEDFLKMVVAKHQRNMEIFRRVSAGETQAAMAREYGVTEQTISEIMTRIRTRYRRPREDIAAEHLAESEKIREPLAALAFAAEAAAAVAGKDGNLVPVLDEDGQVIPGRYAHDVSAKLDDCPCSAGWEE